MPPVLQRSLPVVLLLLLGAFLLSLFFYPSISSSLSIVLLLASLIIASIFIVQKHLRSYKEGQITRPKFIRNILVDMIGLLLTIAVASFLGRMTALSLGKSLQTWMALIAAIAVAFLAGWAVRAVWNRLLNTK